MLAEVEHSQNVYRILSKRKNANQPLSFNHEAVYGCVSAISTIV